VSIQKEFQVDQPKKYSAHERERILSEALDSDKIQLICGRHHYVASETPPDSTGCKMCWQAWYMHKIATTPPHLRLQRLEEMERMVYDAVKSVEKGEWDYEPFDKPQIEISKEN
jgi:hypothetical protein